MFDSSLFNQFQLFQKFSGLYQKLSPLNSDVDEFLYCANSAIVRIMAVKQYNFDCINEFCEREPHLTVINTSRINFFSSSLVRLLNEIPTYFSEMRKLQNIFLKVLVAELDLQEKPPKSLNKAIKNSLEKYNIPSEICDLIYKYWNQSGNQVKEYRDIDQHWHHIVSRAWLQLEPEKKIIIILPDGKGKVSYDNNINAIDFMENSFYDFYVMVDNVAEILGYIENKPFPYGIQFNPPAYVIPGDSDRLICLMAFDSGQISGTEIFTKNDENSIVAKFLPKRL